MSIPNTPLASTLIPLNERVRAADLALAYANAAAARMIVEADSSEVFDAALTTERNAHRELQDMLRLIAARHNLAEAVHCTSAQPITENPVPIEQVPYRRY